MKAWTNDKLGVCASYLGIDIQENGALFTITDPNLKKVEDLTKIVNKIRVSS